MRIDRSWFVVLAGATVALSACGGGAVTLSPRPPGTSAPTAAPSASASPNASASPSAGATKSPSPTSTPTSTPTPAPSPTVAFGALQLIPIPGITTGGKFSYDVGATDPSARRYYLADRTNASLDIVDLDTFAVRQVTGGFTGNKKNSATEGPNGIVVVPGGSVYVSDVNSVKVVDPVAGAITSSIATDTAGVRTDGGCYDADDHLILYANPEDATPYVSFISTITNAVVATLAFPGSTGLESCVYDPGTKNFFLNNDGTASNPNGELDAIVAASAASGSPAVAQTYPEGSCGPAGMALGPNENLLIGCDAPMGSPQITLIVNALSGAVVRTISQVGGTDEVGYDPQANRYYTASRDMTANGISQTGASSPTFTPVLGIIDASTNTWIENLPTNSDSHSVAVDPTTGHVFVPFLPTATSTGGIEVFGR